MRCSSGRRIPRSRAGRSLKRAWCWSDNRRHAGAGAVSNERIERHTIAVVVDNEPGVLARVIGLFSGRGYNIESLTVAETDSREHQSRITVVTSGTPMIIEQIKAQLERLVPVHKV